MQLEQKYWNDVGEGLGSQFCRINMREQSNMNLTFKPSANPGPRKDLDEVLLALSKLDLKISGSPSLEVKGKMSE